MEERRNNKLEVKLELMKGKELDALSGFAASFARSVSDLDKAMNSYAERIEKIVMSSEKQGPLGVSANGMVGGASPIVHAGDMYAARLSQNFGMSHQSSSGLILPSAYVAGSAGTTVGSSGTAAVAGGQGGGKPPGSYDMNEEVFLATLMSNPLKAFTAQPLLAKGIGSVAGALSGANGRFGKSMQWLGDNPQVAAAGMTTLGAAYMGANFASGGYNQYAQQAGLDTGADSQFGWRALPGINVFATEGGAQAFRAKWSDKVQSLSPTWSAEQGRDLRQTMASMGMTEDPDGIMRRSIRDGHSGSTVAAFMNHARRYRADQVGSVEDTLDNLARSAKAAGMSVEEFSAQAAAASATMSRELGIGARAGANIAMVGSAYGLSPEQSAGLMTRENTFRSMGFMGNSGGSMGQRYWTASQSLTSNIDSTKMMATQILGKYGIQDYEKLARAAEKGDKSAQDKIGMMNMITSTTGMSELFGGMNAEQLGQLYNPKNEGAARAKALVAQITDGPGDTSGILKDNKRLKQVLSDAKVSKKAQKKFFKGFSELSESEKKDRLAATVMGKGGVENRSESKAVLDLTPDAKRLVKMMDGSDDTPNKNKSKSNARKAIEVATMVNPVTMPVASSLKAYDYLKNDVF